MCAPPRCCHRAFGASGVLMLVAAVPWLLAPDTLVRVRPD